MDVLRSQQDCMLMEAKKWREGLRAQKGPRCLCREWAKRGIPVNELGHIVDPRGMCFWEYAVFRLYELERQLGL